MMETKTKKKQQLDKKDEEKKSKKKTKKVVKEEKQLEVKNENKKVSKKVKTDKKVKEYKIKKEDKPKKEKKHILRKIGGFLKRFFNSPQPIIVVLIIWIIVLLVYISQTGVKDKIYAGLIETSDKVAVANIHYFTNSNLDLFYASTATFTGDDVKVYSYQIGYYVKDGDDLIEFATRSSTSLDEAVSLSELVSEFSYYYIVENAHQTTLFTKDVINNMGNLYFVIRASTDKDNTDNADINYEIPVEISDITK